MIWNIIREWFNHHAERNKVVQDFNRNAKHAYISGQVPTLLKARISWGNSRNKHAFSNTWSGFRIKVANNGRVDREFCEFLGGLIKQDQSLVRQLISCGFDTLEVFGMEGDGFQTGLALLLPE